MSWVIGGPESITEGTLSKLPVAKRLGGADTAAAMAAVVKEFSSRGLPVNVACVADESRPVDAAIAAATVARLGGYPRRHPRRGLGDSREPDQRHGHLRRGRPAGGGPKRVVEQRPALIVVFAVLAAAGIFLLDRASRKNP